MRHNISDRIKINVAEFAQIKINRVIDDHLFPAGFTDEREWNSGTAKYFFRLNLMFRRDGKNDPRLRFR